MNLYDIVSVRVDGRYYISRVVGGTSKTATVEFLSKVPAIDGHRRKRRSFYLSKFRPHGVAGVDWTVEVGVGKRGDG
jgi:hypothetical protein